MTLSTKTAVSLVEVNQAIISLVVNVFPDGWTHKWPEEWPNGWPDGLTYERTAGWSY